MAPKAGLDAQDTDSLLQIGYISNRTLNQVKNAGASLTTDNGTMGQGYWEQAGARPGDALTLNRTASGTALYFGLRVTATPAPPALLTALMGALPMGGLLLRRRFAS